MKERDYLWCLLHMMRDDEELLEGLCPRCREKANEARCTVCAALLPDVTAEENESFDMARFDALREGGASS